MLPGKNDDEYLVRGRAVLVTEPAVRAVVVEAAAHVLRPEDWVFGYHIESAATTVWENVGQPNTRPIRQRWRES